MDNASELRLAGLGAVRITWITAIVVCVLAIVSGLLFGTDGRNSSRHLPGFGFIGAGPSEQLPELALFDPTAALASVTGGKVQEKPHKTETTAPQGGRSQLADQHAPGGTPGGGNSPAGGGGTGGGSGGSADGPGSATTPTGSGGGGSTGTGTGGGSGGGGGGGTVDNTVNNVNDTVSGVTDTVNDTVSGTQDTVNDTVSGTTDTVKDTVDNVTNTVNNTVNGLLGQ